MRSRSIRPVDEPVSGLFSGCPGGSSLPAVLKKTTRLQRDPASYRTASKRRGQRSQQGRDETSLLSVSVSAVRPASILQSQHSQLDRSSPAVSQPLHRSAVQQGDTNPLCTQTLVQALLSCSGRTLLGLPSRVAEALGAGGWRSRLEQLSVGVQQKAGSVLRS